MEREKKMRQNNLNYIPRNTGPFRSKEFQHINSIFMIPHYGCQRCSPRLADNGNVLSLNCQSQKTRHFQRIAEAIPVTYPQQHLRF